MCLSCWNDYGAPQLDSPAIRAAAEAIAAVYDLPEGGAGGSLHVVVDDFNIDDDDLPWAQQWLNEHQDDPEARRVEQNCLDKLRALTLEERASALSLHRGYWVPTGEKP